MLLLLSSAGFYSAAISTTQMLCKANASPSVLNSFTSKVQITWVWPYVATDASGKSKVFWTNQKREGKAEDSV